VFGLVAAESAVALREVVLREKYTVKPLEDQEALRKISIVKSMIEYFVLLEIARQGPFFRIMMEEDCPSTLTKCLAPFSCNSFLL
jgi:hypothetical protein